MSRLIKAFGFAANGAIVSFSKERHFKIHFCFAIAVVISGWYFVISLNEWILLLTCTGFVLCMEMINTAIEHLCNIIYKEDHHGIKIIKDISAGAVLISAITAAICGMIVFIPKIFLLFK
ncbi:MAG TPA: diacylglycerol kinase family protein [Ferruginibacter sp.]|nr:diacylglycerol kinase family protein [Ferruginibacter sp.]